MASSKERINDYPIAMWRVVRRALLSTQAQPSIRLRLKADMLQALKQKDAARTSVLRQVYAEVIKADKAVEGPPRDDQSRSDIAVIQKCVKKWRETIQEYQRLVEDCSADQALRLRSAMDKESDELRMIEAYLPAPYSEEELRVHIEEALSRLNLQSPTPGQLGPVMKHLLGVLEVGRFDKKHLSSLVATLLSEPRGHPSGREECTG